MTITLYQFSKRQNSTKQPSNTTPHVDVTVYLKEPCDEFTPVFQLETQSADTYNYVKWGSRYYWITSKTYITSDILEIHCTKDLFATFKSDIGSSSQYIIRSSYGANGHIIDSLYPITTDRTGDYQKVSKLADMWDHSRGFYVVGIICSGQNAGDLAGRIRRGSVVYLILTEQQARDFSDQFNQLSGFLSSVRPADFLVSFTYIPISMTGIAQNLPQAPAKIHIGSAVGGWDLTVPDCVPSTSQTLSGLYTYTPSPASISLNSHPDAMLRGEYLNYPPFTQLTAYLGPFGTVNLTQLETSYGGYGTLYYNFTIDLCTGQAIFRFYNGTIPSDLSGATISRIGRLGVPIQLVTSTYGNLSSTVSAIGSAIGMIGGIATGNAALAGSAAAGFIGSAASSLTPKNDSVGSNGSFAELYRPYILEQFFKVTDDDNADRGRPLCVVGQISNYPGYIQTSDCDIALMASDAEIISIRNQMNAGFFYE